MTNTKNTILDIEKYVAGWSTKKLKTGGFEYCVAITGYQVPAHTLVVGTANTRQKAMLRAKKAVMYFRNDMNNCAAYVK